MGTFRERLKTLVDGAPVLGLTAAQAEALLATKGLSDDAGLNVGDLLLALQALARHRPALLELDRRLVAVCRGVKSRGLDPDDLVQLVRARVLVGPPPRLTTYSGRGALSQWLRAVALTTVSHATRGKAAQPAEDAGDEMLALVAQGPGPELRAVDASRGRVLARALSAALEGFTAEERTLLRLRFVNGLSHDELARVFGTHRTTALRNLERCHARLTQAFAAQLEGLELSRAEFNSLSRLFEGSFVMHLHRALGA